MTTCPPSLRSAVSRREQSATEDRHANARDDNKPKAYQKGWVEFYKLRFKVNKDVLIPRPETELLVDEVLHFTNNLPTTIYSLTILDLGTGSGAIAISIAKNLYPTPGVGVKIIASDISEKALEVAKQNAKLHGVKDEITFIQSDLLDVIPAFAGIQKEWIPGQAWNDNQIDIIVTNLPYIPTARILYLDSSVKDFEPFVALDGGEDGFELYRRLFQQLATLGVVLGWHPRLIVGEIDYTHGELAILEAQKYFPNAKVEVKKDLFHRQRILIIKSK